jgi:hypothetical protein
VDGVIDCFIKTLNFNNFSYATKSFIRSVDQLKGRPEATLSGEGWVLLRIVFLAERSKAEIVQRTVG